MALTRSGGRIAGSKIRSVMALEEEIGVGRDGEGMRGDEIRGEEGREEGGRRRGEK
jgi:hypothetical protein